MTRHRIELVSEGAQTTTPAGANPLYRTVELTDAPASAGQVPMTVAGGRVPAAGVDVGSPATLTIHAAPTPLSMNVSSDGSPIAGLCVQQHYDSPGVAPYIMLAHANGTAAAPTVSVDGDTLGIITALGYDGVDYEEAARIDFYVSGTVGSNDLGGKIVMSVTPDGGFAPAAALTIDQDKSVALAGALTVTGTTTVAATQRIVSCLTEVVTAASLVNGGAGLGTKVLAMSIPVGARIEGIDVTVEAGFAGDVSATFKLGDGVDDDRYMTGAPSVFATAAAGIAAGIPSGAVNVLVANTPTVTINSAGDIALVIAGGGSLTVRVYFIPRS